MCAVTQCRPEGVPGFGVCGSYIKCHGGWNQMVLKGPFQPSPLCDTTKELHCLLPQYFLEPLPGDLTDYFSPQEAVLEILCPFRE